jgi:hypothetical protein
MVGLVDASRCTAVDPRELHVRYNWNWADPARARAVDNYYGIAI